MEPDPSYKNFLVSVLGLPLEFGGKGIERRMAGESTLFKFLNPTRRLQPTDIKAAAGWGVAAATTALWLIQPFDWIKKTFLEKPQDA